MTDDIDLITTEEEVLVSIKPFSALGRIFIRPCKTIREITLNDKAIWILPLAILMLTAFVLVMATSSVEKQFDPGIEMPPDMEYYPESYQEQFDQAATVSGGFVSTIILPSLLRWAGIWASWALLAVLLMILLMAGGHSLAWRGIFNLIGWSMLPFAVRDIVQTVFVLSSRSLISQPGLSGFMAPEGGNFVAYLSGVVALVDIYLILQWVLIIMGLRGAAHLKATKATMTSFVALLLQLLIRGIPSYVMLQLSGLFASGMIFF